MKPPGDASCRDAMAARFAFASGAPPSVVTLVVQLSRKLLARVDPELSVHVAQVVLDGLRAEEELGRSLPRRVPVGEEHADLELLRGQLVEAGGIAPPRALARGKELRARPLGPRRGSEPVERLERRAELLARIDALTRPAQELAEAELRARLLEAVTRGLVQPQRLGEVTLEPVPKQRARALEPRERPRLSLALGGAREVGYVSR